MDHIQLLNQVRDKKNLRRAFHYAIHDRLENDYYIDYFEIEYAINNQRKVLTEISKELRDISSFKARPAYAHYPSKNSLCHRRMIYIPIKDLVVRYAVVTILAELLDDDLSETCFANRRASENQAQYSLLDNFATVSWPNFCKWQKKCAKTYGSLGFDMIL